MLMLWVSRNGGPKRWWVSRNGGSLSSLVNADRCSVKHSNSLVIIGVVHLGTAMLINAGLYSAGKQFVEASVNFNRVYVFSGVLCFFCYLSTGEGMLMNYESIQAVVMALILVSAVLFTVKYFLPELY